MTRLVILAPAMAVKLYSNQAIYLFYRQGSQSGNDRHYACSCGSTTAQEGTWEYILATVKYKAVRSSPVFVKLRYARLQILQLVVIFESISYNGSKVPWRFW